MFLVAPSPIAIYPDKLRWRQDKANEASFTVAYGPDGTTVNAV